MNRKVLLLILLVVLVQLTVFTGCNPGAREVNVNVDGTDAAFSEENEDAANAGDGNRGVVTETVADVFSEPDIKSERITQAIFNQPVTILEEYENWFKVEVVDGNIGWIKSNFIDKDCSSIEPDKYKYKIVITAKSKTVSSQAKGGITIKEAVMGTEFYSNYKEDDLYEVALPGKLTGWIKGSGIIEIPVGGKILETSAEDFVATLAKFKGTKYLYGGVSSWGIDSSGLTYICSRINGINLPRDIDDQFYIGKKVSLSEIKEGDLIFFSANKDSKDVSHVGVYTGDNQFIHANKDKGYVMYSSLDSGNFAERLLGIRRIFDK
ncbi:MAG TPA: SH3 domain-containing protein [Clostridiaceae bacterium]|nr:SH3 domain-containing protein [Clostridiaceae bacterium]